MGEQTFGGPLQEAVRAARGRCRSWFMPMARDLIGVGLAIGLAIGLTFGLTFGLSACAGPAGPTATPDTTGAGRASSAPDQDPTALTDAMAAALVRASDATLGVLVHTVDGARSARTLGTHRMGSGVVIGDDGLVLTIGYLVLEADEVLLQLDDGRRLPARVVGYDQATGFGLVQALAPLGITPVPLGRSRQVGADEPLLVVSGGRASQAGQLSQTRLAQRRDFAGYWEYFIAGALFTSPPRDDHSGAGLFNRQGELVGIGSLLMADVREATGSEGDRRPGNMFVPIDLLQPVLGELRQSGSTRASQRAWIGLNCAEAGGRLTVIRVNEDSPAAAAGLRPGDVITALDGRDVKTLAEFYRRLWAEGPAERDLVLAVQRRGGPAQDLQVHSVDRITTLRRQSGI